MCKAQKINIARLVYDSYPHSDLLPLDPEKDCRDLQVLVERIRSANIGDTLFQFLVLEIVEGGEGKIDGAIRVIERASDDVAAVLRALIRARDGRAEDHRGRRNRGPRPTDLSIWRCPDCCRCLYRSYKRLAQAAAPYCPGCGCEMRLA